MTESMSVFRPSRIAGFATDTIVVSIRIMKKPMMSDQRAGQGLISESMLLPVRVVRGRRPGCRRRDPDRAITREGREVFPGPSAEMRLRDPLVVVDDLGDDEGEELLRERRVQVRLLGE